VIGTGEYLDDVKNDIQNEVVEFIEQMTYRGDGYVFAGNWDGLSLSGPSKGKIMYDVTDVNGIKIVKELIHLAKQGGGYLEYVMPKLENQRPAPKLSYVVGVPKWKWYIGTGIYIDEIETAIQQRKQEVKRNIISHAIHMVFILIGIILFVSFVTLRIARKASANLDLFSHFFTQAAVESTTIHPDKMDFKELESLAHAANNMISARKQAEEALRESEKRYRSLFKHNCSVMLLIDPESADIIDANPAAVSFYGWSHEELTGKKITDINTLTENQTFQEMELARRKQRQHFYFQHRLANGKIRDVEVYSGAIKVHGKELLYSIVHNISDRKRAEKALRESEEKHRNLVERANDGIIIVQNGIVKFFNTRLLEIVGYTDEEMIEAPFIDYVFPDNRSRITDIYKRRLQGEDVPDIYEMAALHKDGTRIDVEINSGMITYHGKPGTLSFVRDITERKRAMSALHESEKKYRELANFLPQVVFEMDENSVITFANRNAFDFFGYTQNDFDNGLSVLQMLIPEDRDRATENLRRRLSGEKFGGIEYTARRKDAGTFPVLVHVNPVIRENKPVGLRGLVIDITEHKLAEQEKKKLEARLQQSQKMESIGTLAGGIAHDFNNILFSLLGYTELALDDAETGTPLHDNLQEVLTAAQRAKDLVKQILTFSRQASQKLKPLKVQPVVREALKLIRSSLPTTIEIHQNISNTCGLVMADATQIHQVVMNLMTNAFHAMEDQGGKLDVTLKEVDLDVDDLKDPAMVPGTYVCLTVADTGAGIDESIIDRIFEPYFSTKEKDKGTGLGLAMVHGIVKNYGGNMRVYSEPDKGTVFHVYLPVIESKADVRKTLPIEPARNGSEKILCVDDEDQIVQLEKQILERLGYQVITRTSSIDALETFRAEPDKFDLVITDMTMPEITGIQLSQKLRDIRADIPIIMCSGFAEKINHEKTKIVDINGYTVKPVLKSEFARIIRQVLDGEQK
jgi:PAS domain S-box-containing protein